VNVSPTLRPLGVRPEVPLRDQELRTLQLLQDYDLTPIRARLMRDGHMPSDWVDEAMLEFRRYLGLHFLVPCPRLMFSDHVDHVWHTCLLFSRLYADFCQQTLGYFFHHEPATGTDPERDAKFVEFAHTYERIYGKLSHLWRKGAACG
jgi:hypothetical protein